MKRLFVFLTLCLMLPTIVEAQNGVTFEIEGGTTNMALKATIERQITKLLVMLNESQAVNKRTLNFGGINITKEARQTIELLYKYHHLRVWQDDPSEDAYICENLIKVSKAEYQIRNIAMRFYESNGEEKYTEVSIDFDRAGTIVDFNTTMGKHQYSELLKNSNDVEDEKNRMQIAHWMDRLKTAYNTGNIAFFKDVFSEDALIITGRRVMTRQKTDARLIDQEAYEYNKQTKWEYIKGLGEKFKTKVIHVEFYNQRYAHHGTSSRYYLVDCGQTWSSYRKTDGSLTYDDDGHLVVIWDFKDPEKPQILVRVWEDKSKERKYTFSDFRLPK